MEKSYRYSEEVKQIMKKYDKYTQEKLYKEYEKQMINQDIEKCIAILNILKAKNLQAPQHSERILKLYDKAMYTVDIMGVNEEGWREERFGKNKQCRLSTKVVSAGRVFIRFDGEMEINIFNLASMVYEVELFPKWVPFCKEAETIKSIPNAQKIAKVAFDIPLLSRKEGFLFGQGIDRIQHNGSVLIYAQGITGNQQEQEFHDVSLQMQQNSVLLNLKYFSCQITIIKQKTYRFRAFGDIDLEMSFVPGFVLGYLSKKIGHWLLDKMISMANNIEGTPYQQRIKQDESGFYKWLGEKVKKFQELHSKK